ncbi:MAG: HlyD family efflux transporter periplasmic adaptor subunit, partial [Planctomycetota bacterium]|nr:HlyD family efflux transporter periplasmic adaptor subunit [Planctomycetota bacterium]
EGRHVIDCDRVTVLVDKGGKLRAEAVSGQDTFDDRASAIRSLVKLARSVGGTDEPLWYPEDSGKLSPQLEEAVERYVDEADSTTLAVLPLHDCRKQTDTTSPDKTRGPLKRTLIGMLIVERFDGENSAGYQERVIAVRDSACSALANAVQHQSVFLLPVWQSMGNAGRALRAPKAIVIGALICVAIVALFIVPADFQMKADGELQPVLRSDVFAATDGIVDVVKTRHGEVVRRGQLLVRMKNANLESELARLEGERSTTVERLRSVRTLMLKNRRMSNSERDRLYSQQTEIEQALAGIEAQIVIHNQTLTQLETTSPVDGQVVTWDVAETLHRRPIQRGQLLMTVAQPDGPWQLEIRMPEGQMGHVLRAHAEGSHELGVEYMLASEPGRTYHGTVREIHDRAEVRGAEGSTVLMKVGIDKNDIQHLKPGAEVIAKVECGRRSVGYVWFHEVFEFVQSKILFRM